MGAGVGLRVGDSASGSGQNAKILDMDTFVEACDGDLGAIPHFADVVDWSWVVESRGGIAALVGAPRVP